MKKLKNVFYLAAIVASAVVVGCEKDVDDVKAVNSSLDDVIKIPSTSIDVDAVEVAVYYVEDNKTKTYVLAEAKSENGEFTIRLPASVPAQYLSPISKYFSRRPEVEVNDVNANWTYGGGFYIFACKDKGTVGDFWYGNGENYAFFCYVDRDVNVTGVDGEFYWSLFLKKGWNKCYMKSTTIVDLAIGGKQYDLEFYTTSTEPSGLTWNYKHYVAVDDAITIKH
ncbi:hypothetical protein AGMMS4957_13250 [Bacteroidia bacterium]|nr:hypothetical protein AGMMS4957_13250 [Bacteroidia bacterium]